MKLLRWLWWVAVAVIVTTPIPIEVPITGPPPPAATPPNVQFDPRRIGPFQWLRYDAPKYVVQWAHDVVHVGSIGLEDVMTAGSWAWDHTFGLFGSVPHVDMHALSNMITNAVHAAFSIIGNGITSAISMVTTEISALGTWAVSRVLVLDNRVTAAGRAALDLEHKAEAVAYNLTANASKTLRGEIRVAEGDAYRLVTGATAAIEAWAIDNIAHPLLKELDHVRAGVEHDIGSAVGSVRDDLTKLIEGTNAKTLAEIATVAGVATAVAEWVKECGDEMCSTVGPKTDWGKLLKRFAPTAILAMLGAIAAENPQAVEAAAEELAHVIGPVLSSWVEQWAVGGGGFPSQPSEVGGALGRLPGA